MAPQGRMRGEPAVAARVLVIAARPPLISQRSGPLTASPKGEAGRVYGKVAPALHGRGRACPALSLA